MLFDEKDSELLKTWIVKRLENVSDADSDVLADYILALVTTDAPEAIAKVSCVNDLKDFLGEPEKFVDDIFEAIATRSYDPSRPPPKPAAPTYHPPRRTSLEPPRQQTDSRKRSYHDWDRDDAQNGIFSFEGERPLKQPRRGGRGGFVKSFQPPFPQQMPNMPSDLPPPFDPNDPMAQMFMQQVMGMFPSSFQQDMEQLNCQGQRCRDYDTIGFCARGASCPFQHTNDEYDPTQATLLHVQPTRTGVVKTSPGGRGRGGNRGRGGGPSRGGRSSFSHLGRTDDKTLSTLVVEQIPEDSFDEESVRGYFSQFGNIMEVTMQPYKRLAIVKYDNHDSAKAAYDSPKVIFDNRFVKVYWHKFESNGNDNAVPTTDGGEAQTHQEKMEMEIDPVEFAKRQEEAQRRYDEQKKQREEAENQKNELDAKVKAIEDERKQMTDILAKKRGGKSASPAADTNTETDKTKALRAQLAQLEEEAKSLGIDPEAAAANSYGPPYGGAPAYSPRGRGGFRGRPRGRGFQSHRGSWRGGRGGAVMRLDNRPKALAVKFQDGSYADHEESLRQWLLFNQYESATLSRHPADKVQDTAIVSFEERYVAEDFKAAVSTKPDFPGDGKVDITWYKPDSDLANGSQAPESKSVPHSGIEAQDAQMQDEAPPVREVDEDLDHDDRWQ